MKLLMSSKIFIEANDHTSNSIEHYLVKDKYFGGGGGGWKMGKMS